MKNLLQSLVVLFLLVAPAIAGGLTGLQDSPADPSSPFLASESRSFLLENARVVDGTGAAAREGLSLLIEDGLISAVGRSDEVAVPPDAERIDLGGHTVLPGLIMMHEHVAYICCADPGDPGVVLHAHPDSVPKLLLAAGVTTARTAGSEQPQVDLNLKRHIDAGEAVGPTLFITAPYLNGPRTAVLGDFVVESAAQAREIVRFWVGQGATSVKVYTSLGPEALEATIEEAHRLGAHVAGHLGVGTSCAEAAELGIDTIEHSFSSCQMDLPAEWRDDPGAMDPRAPEVVSLIDTLVEHDVVLVTTPWAGFPTEEELSMLSPNRLALRKKGSGLPPSVQRMVDQSEVHREMERAFVTAGGTLLIGADATVGGHVPGYKNHQNMIALAEAFSPVEIIKMATSDAAAFLDIGDRTGRVLPGLEADLLIVRGEPDVDMGDVRNVSYVFKDGRAFDPEKLREASKGLIGIH